MTQQEYNKAKRECLLDFCIEHDCYITPEVGGIFGAAFDRAYTLCKQEKDAEGEDKLLGVSLKQIDALQGEIFDAIMDAHDDDDWQAAAHYILDVMPRSFAALFGSKCLPDNVDGLDSNVDSSEPKPAEPKFKVGDKVRIKGCGYEPNLHKGDIGEILDTNDKEQCFVLFKKSQAWIYVDCLEPYTEPKEREENAQERATLTDDCQSQCKIHHIGDANDMIDDIIKNSFREHNRLHIAAMMVPSVIATVPCSENEKGYAKMVATRARILADALISECKKGGENE